MARPRPSRRVSRPSHPRPVRPGAHHPWGVDARRHCASGADDAPARARRRDAERLESHDEPHRRRTTRGDWRRSASDDHREGDTIVDRVAAAERGRRGGLSADQEHRRLRQAPVRGRQPRAGDVDPPVQCRRSIPQDGTGRMGDVRGRRRHGSAPWHSSKRSPSGRWPTSSSSRCSSPISPRWRVRALRPPVRRSWPLRRSSAPVSTGSPPTASSRWRRSS